MESKNINDRKIAKFMGVIPEGNWYNGYELHKAGLPFSYGAMGNGTSDLKFSTSLDWQLPVIEKIESLKMKNGDWFMVSTNGFKTSIIRKDIMGVPYFDEEIVSGNNGRKENTYQAIVQFIDWYELNNS